MPKWLTTVNSCFLEEIANFAFHGRDNTGNRDQKHRQLVHRARPRYGTAGAVPHPGRFPAARQPDDQSGGRGRPGAGRDRPGRRRQRHHRDPAPRQLHYPARLQPLQRVAHHRGQYRRGIPGRHARLSGHQHRIYRPFPGHRRGLQDTGGHPAEQDGSVLGPGLPGDHRRIRRHLPECRVRSARSFGENRNGDRRAAGTNAGQDLAIRAWANRRLSTPSSRDCT